jgi:hypothetical protein
LRCWPTVTPTPPLFFDEAVDGEGRGVLHRPAAWHGGC